MAQLISKEAEVVLAGAISIGLGMVSLAEDGFDEEVKAGMNFAMDILIALGQDKVRAALIEVCTALECDSLFAFNNR